MDYKDLIRKVELFGLSSALLFTTTKAIDILDVDGNYQEFAITQTIEAKTKKPKTVQTYYKGTKIVKSKSTTTYQSNGKTGKVVVVYYNRSKKAYQKVTSEYNKSGIITKTTTIDYTTKNKVEAKSVTTYNSAGIKDKTTKVKYNYNDNYKYSTTTTITYINGKLNRGATEKIVVLNKNGNLSSTITYNYTSSSNKVIDMQEYKKGLPILMYHRFYDKELGEQMIDKYYFDIQSFEEEMIYLKENDYYFPTWQEVQSYIQGKIQLPKKSVVITIDDGDESFFRLAKPILEKYDIRATAFLITSLVDDQILIEHESDVIQYESHTNDMHKKTCNNNLRGAINCVTESNGLKDLHTSIDLLGSNEVIAYPFGHFNNAAYNLVKKAGFKLGVTVYGGRVKVGMDPLTLPRTSMNAYHYRSLKNFIELVSPYN